MPERFLNTQIADFLGGSTLLTSISLWSMDLFSLAHINDLLTTITLLGGLFWLFYKVKNARLDSKLKQKELDE